MKSFLTLLFSGVFFLFSFTIFAQNFLDRISFDEQRFTEIQAFDLFDIDKTIKNENFEGTGLKNGLILKPNFEIVSEILKQSGNKLKVNLQTSESHTVILKLQEVNIFADGALVRTSSGKRFELKDVDGRFFWGVVEGYPNSMVNINFFEDQIIGYVSIGMHDFTLGKLNDDPKGLHIFYHNSELVLPFQFECQMDEEKHRVGGSGNYHSRSSRSSDGCINMYVETDYNVFQNKGSVSEVVDYVLGLFSQVIILFADEDIDMAVSEIFVWDSPSPYSGSNAFDYLEQFSDELDGSFNGDLAHLLRIEPSLGGVAWVDVLCNWNPYFSTGFSGIASTYQDVPAYSWSVNVVAHELGHNIGSGHTHGCYWNNNETQVDDCGNVYANNNGFPIEGEDCFNSNNPILPSNGGTIMSYCHLIQGVGINFNNGFGQQVGNLMRSRVSSASCLGDCAGVNFPVADFSGEPTFGCAPLEVQFTDLSENDPTSWQWDFPGGNPTTSMVQFPSVIYDFAGIFDVSLEVSNDDGSDELTFENYITVEDIPTATFTFNIDDLTVGFINTSENAFSYQWDFGDGNSSFLENPVHTYEAGGTYIVGLTVFNNCGDDIFSVQIDVFEMPVADFTNDVSFGCAPLTVKFSNTSSGNPDLFNWDFPGGSPSNSNEENPEVTYQNAGVFDVSLTVGNPIGNSTLEIDELIEVLSETEADFDFEIEGRNVVFSNLADNIDSLSWDFGDGNTSTDSMPEHLYSEDGEYEVVLIAIGECGIDTISKILEILTPPIAGFDYALDAICVPVTVSFFNLSSSNTDSILWLFPGGIPATSAADTVHVTYEESGSFDFSLIAFGTGGIDTLFNDSLLILQAAPSGEFNFEITNFEVSFFQNTSNTDTWEWDFGDGTKSSDENPTHLYQNEGRYDVLLSLYNICDTIELNQTITIGDFPASSFSIAGESNGCVPFSVDFINQSTPVSADFIWFFEGGNPETSSMPNPTVIYEIPGAYSVRLIVSNSLGVDTLEIDDFIVADGFPVADFVAIEGVDGIFEFLNTSSGEDSYLWDFGDGNSSTEENPSHQYEVSGNYIVELIAINNCGSDTVSQEIQYTFVYLFDELSARLYPNPSSGLVFVEFSAEVSSDILFEIYDLTGKKLKSGELTRGVSKQPINFDEFPSGSYFLRFVSDQQISRTMQIQIVRD
ncbi:MAG: PKD domain-containing protein [Saprospirales bacterium]|nr:MAG: PKD domain-containing protein [Saprospirales bacterium]